MADVKNSALLDMLIERAKHFDEGHPILTDVRFLIAALEVLDGTAKGNAEELSGLAAALREKKTDAGKLRTMLSEQIKSGRETIVDSVHFSKLLMTARTAAVNAHEAVLTAQAVADAVLADPGTSLRKIMEASAGPADAPASASGASGSGKGELSAEQISEMISASSSSLLGAITGKPSQEQPASSGAEESGDAPASGQPDSGSMSAADIGAMVSRTSMSDLLGGNDGSPLPPAPAETAVPEGEESLGELTARTAKLREVLLKNVFGQDHAVSAFLDGYFQGEFTAKMDKERIRPRATFLFAGPPGVGKTLLAEQAAAALGLPFQRFDMSEYADKEANLEFAGFDAAYKGAKAGAVTGFVAKHPRCVLLFDEIEKAHPVVICLFLQLLDAGRVRDNYTDKEVPFKDAIIFFTTNAGRSIYEMDETQNYSSLSRKVILRALATEKNPQTGGAYFPGAILSRFSSGNVVMFNHISSYNLLRVAAKELSKKATQFEAAQGITTEFDSKVFPALLYGEGGAADARAVRGRSEMFFLSELYELSRLIGSEKVSSDIEQLKKVRFSVSLPKDQPEVLDLFERCENQFTVLLFAQPEMAQFCRETVPFCRMIEAQTAADAMQKLKETPVDMILVDIMTGLKEEQEARLNAEDVESEARDFFRYVVEECSSYPIYMLETEAYPFSAEESVSFLRQGVRAVLRPDGNLSNAMAQISEELHQQANMNRLASSGRVLKYCTMQTISEDGSEAQIKLFDF